MYSAQMTDALEVAKTFIESLGGDGLNDRFFPSPDPVEVGTENGHTTVTMRYHTSTMLDPDRAVVVEALSKLPQVQWGTSTNPFGVAWVETDEQRVQIVIEIFVPGPSSRGPLLKAALFSAGWASVVGVG